jgi:hypothetical protein
MNAVKISRRRSSGISLVSWSGSSMAVINPDTAYDSSFSENRARRRMRSIAVCRAVWTIHAYGDSGTLEDRHWARAAAKASCTASSAT